MVKLISITKSSRPEKKYMALFDMGGRTKLVHFGASGYDDYTITNDPVRKALYIARHAKKEDWTASGVTTSGALSRWVLWNKKTLSASIADFKSRFNL
jgi:hypothetical protein